MFLGAHRQLRPIAAPRRTAQTRAQRLRRPRASTGRPALYLLQCSGPCVSHGLAARPLPGPCLAPQRTLLPGHAAWPHVAASDACETPLLAPPPIARQETVLTRARWERKRCEHDSEFVASSRRATKGMECASGAVVELLRWSGGSDQVQEGCLSRRRPGPPRSQGGRCSAASIPASAGLLAPAHAAAPCA